MESPKRMLLRIWLPDRPGALGAVTTRLGAVRADVVGLEVVERGGGQAIDELVVDLPEDVPVNLLLREVMAENDVTVEELREIEPRPFDAHLDALDAATAILDSESLADLAATLCAQVSHYVRASWAVTIDESETILASSGQAPTVAWLSAFTSGSPTLFDDAVIEEIDTVWAPLTEAGARLVVGRETAFRTRERQRVAALTAVADHCVRGLATQSRLASALVHPALQ